MRIYLASGYSVMNVAGRERELALFFSVYRRLVSYHDHAHTGNKIMNTLNLKK